MLRPQYYVALHRMGLGEMVCIYYFSSFLLFLSSLLSLLSSLLTPFSSLPSSLSHSPPSCLSSSAVCGSMYPRALYLLYLWSTPTSTHPSPSLPRWGEGTKECLVERGKLCNKCLGARSELTLKCWSVNMALFRLRPKRKTITGTVLRFRLKRKTITGTLLRFWLKRKTIKN